MSKSILLSKSFATGRKCLVISLECFPWYIQGAPNNFKNHGVKWDQRWAVLWWKHSYVHGLSNGSTTWVSPQINVQLTARIFNEKICLQIEIFAEGLSPMLSWSQHHIQPNTRSRDGGKRLEFRFEQTSFATLFTTQSFKGKKTSTSSRHALHPNATPGLNIGCMTRTWNSEGNLGNWDSNSDNFLIWQSSWKNLHWNVKAFLYYIPYLSIGLSGNTQANYGRRNETQVMGKNTGSQNFVCTQQCICTKFFDP